MERRRGRRRRRFLLTNPENCAACRHQHSFGRRNDDLIVRLGMCAIILVICTLSVGATTAAGSPLNLAATANKTKGEQDAAVLVDILDSTDVDIANLTFSNETFPPQNRTQIHAISVDRVAHEDDVKSQTTTTTATAAAAAAATTATATATTTANATTTTTTMMMMTVGSIVPTTNEVESTTDTVVERTSTTTTTTTTTATATTTANNTQSAISNISAVAAAAAAADAAAATTTQAQASAPSSTKSDDMTVIETMTTTPVTVDLAKNTTYAPDTFTSSTVPPITATRSSPTVNGEKSEANMGELQLLQYNFTANPSSVIDTEIVPAVELQMGSKVTAAVQIGNGHAAEMISSNTPPTPTTTAAEKTAAIVVADAFETQPTPEAKATNDFHAATNRYALLTPQLNSIAAAVPVDAAKLSAVKNAVLKAENSKKAEYIKSDIKLQKPETITTTPTTATTPPPPSSISSSITPVLAAKVSGERRQTEGGENNYPKLKNADSSQLLEIPFEITTMDDLREYKRQLSEMLQKVEKELDVREGVKSTPFIPVSANLPNKLSTIFLQRIGAALNFSPDADERDELGKHLLSSPIRKSAVPTPSLSNGKSDATAGYLKAESLMLAAAAAAAAAANNRRFNPVRNHSAAECKHLSEADLVHELKQRGTYNPDLMAWDVSGVLSFLDRSIADQYERQTKSQKSSQQAVKRNVEALERLLSELNLECNVSTPQVMAKLSNLTLAEPRRSIVSPSIRLADDETRYKRNVMVAQEMMHSFNHSKRRDDMSSFKKQKVIGDVHVVPFGCDKRGGEEDGYLRLCGACQAIRKLPESFFPPFINEVMCDEDKACLYFYDYPHGKCKQKHMNFVVLKNIGTLECQIWKKFNLNVRVSCECFVDEMSFFAKYV